MSSTRSTRHYVETANDSTNLHVFTVTVISEASETIFEQTDTVSVPERMNTGSVIETRTVTVTIGDELVQFPWASRAGHDAYPAGCSEGPTTGLDSYS